MECLYRLTCTTTIIDWQCAVRTGPIDRKNALLLSVRRRLSVRPSTETINFPEGCHICVGIPTCISTRTRSFPLK